MLKSVESHPVVETVQGEKPHYLQVEFETLMRDPATIKFLDDGALDGLWYWDLENPDHEWMSPGFWRTLGFDPVEKDHLASEWQDLIFAEDQQLALENFHAHVADPNHPYDQVVRYRTADGGTVTIRCRGLAIRENGVAIRMLGAHTVLHDTRQAAANAQLSQLIELSNDAISSWTQRDGVIRWNRGAERLYGPAFEAAQGRNIHELTGAIWPQDWDSIQMALLEKGEWEGDVERRGPQGEVIFTSTRLQRLTVTRDDTPTADDNADHDRIVILQVDRDITERLLAERRQKLFADELNHRVKNMLAVVQAISLGTFDRSHSDAKAFRGRLQALSSAHGLLTHSTWTNARMANIVAGAISVCPPDRITVSSSTRAINLRPTCAVSVALAIHELCTNAMKYGALSQDSGTVAIDWRVQSDAGEEKLRFTWTEQGGPKPEKDAQTGFGFRMIRQILAADLAGIVETDFKPSGLAVTITAPLAEIVA